MSLYQEYRNQYPNTEFRTQDLRFNSCSHLMTLEVWFWEKLEVLLEVDTPTLDDITALCLTLAQRAVDEEGWDFEYALHELVMYYIYRNYTEYRHFIQGIANDNRDDIVSR